MRSVLFIPGGSTFRLSEKSKIFTTESDESSTNNKQLSPNVPMKELKKTKR